MAHFDGSKCQDVHQRSPALGSILGSKQSGALIPLDIFRGAGYFLGSFCPKLYIPP
jgi:hypothetical protein